MKDRFIDFETPRMAETLGFEHYFFIVLFIASLTAYVSQQLLNFLGFSFVPSEFYVKNSIFFTFICSGIGFVWMTYLVLFSGVVEKSFVHMRAPPPSTLRKIFMKIAWPFLFAYLIYFTAMNFVPMCLSVINGSEVNYTVTVRDPDLVDKKRCRSGIKLSFDSWSDVPHKVCSVPKRVRDQIIPGMNVELQGWGTGFGMFVQSVKIP